MKKLHHILILFIIAFNAFCAYSAGGYVSVKCGWQVDPRDKVVREALVNNNFNAVVDVFFHKGSSAVTADQMANVERIAAYLNKNPNTEVHIKGYTSHDGKSSANYQLAARRAEAVARLLTGRYRISPTRVKASGAGIGEFFEQDAWNRVCVCTFTESIRPAGS